MEQIKVNVPEGCTANIKKEDGFLIVTFEQKKENKWEPKDGDMIAFGKNINNQLIAIYKKPSVDNTFHIHCLVSEHDDKISLYEKGWLNYNMRPATEEEKQRLFDALTKAGLWLDDAQVVDYRVVKMPVTKGGRLELTITEMGNE